VLAASFSAESIDRLLNDLQRVLERMVAQPPQPISGIVVSCRQ
jgi:hypothetical protein